MSSTDKTRVGLPILAVAGAICWECKEATTKHDGTGLSRCTGCKRAVYCSSACQKRNWASEHSTLCKALRRLNAGPKAHGKLTWIEFKALQYQRYRKIIQLDEHGFEPPEAINHARAVQHQPKCENCLQTPFDDVDSKSFHLRPCDDCRLAFFCSSICQTQGLQQHQLKQCAILKDISACDLVKTQHIKRTGEAFIQLPTESPRDTYTPLHTAQSWKDYFEDLSESPFAKFITEDFSPADDDEATLRASRFLKVAVDFSSLILTILAGLEAEVPDLASRTKLTIHIVGPDDQEICRSSMTEELYHLLPKLQLLVVGYIGPDVALVCGDTTKLVDFGCCPKCQKMHRPPRQAFLADDLYHDFAKSDLFAKYPPDLIVAFHTGHSETVRWEDTLHCILELGVPALFTTYNKQEALDEEQSFNKLGAHFSRRPAKNPWRGVLPKLDLFMERYDVYYFNYYWYIVKGKTHG